jgi:chloramphenicol O-acetyltransferase type A
MRIIEHEDPHRRRHFEFFKGMESPHFGIVSPIRVTPLLEYIADHRLHFTGTIVFLISKVANELPEFRWRIRDNIIIEHDLVHPSFTVNTKDSDVFSFCYVDFNQDYRVFAARLREAQKLMHDEPSLEDEDGRDDYLFMSSIPWVHFTGFTHPMRTPSHDSVPRFAWGKIRAIAGDDMMPLNVQAHHAVVDGRHMGMFFERVGAYCENPETLIPN